MYEHVWKVVPLCEKQLRDVRPEDVLHNGAFRLCNTYRGGGGYDQFPQIYERRFGEAGHSLQFVVQLYGCHLACPYCYVTQEGIWGRPLSFTTQQLVEAFERTEASVFHLMGGAPALQLKYWPEIIDRLRWYSPKRNYVFHSDLLLTERRYTSSELKRIRQPRCLYAVDVKGLTDEEHWQNTGRIFDEKTFWYNLISLIEEDVPFYITFTNVSDENIARFWDACASVYQLWKLDDIRRDSFKIDLIEYKALES